MGFSDTLAGLDVAIEAHLCDPATFTPMIGVSRLVAVMVERPSEIERMQGSGFSRARPVLQVSATTVPVLVEGDSFRLSDQEIWVVAAAPTRPGDGRWWVAEVEPG